MKYLLFQKNFYRKKKNNFFYFSDWCEFNIKEKKAINKKNLIGPNFLKDTEIKKKNNFVNKTVDNIFPKIVNKMNSYHGVFYPESYWKKILYPWFMPFTAYLYDRWEIVQSLRASKDYIFCLNKFEDKNVIVDAGKDFNPNSKTLNLWMLSKIVKFNGKIKHIEKNMFKSDLKKNLAFETKKKVFIKKILSSFYYIITKFYKANFFIQKIGLTKFKMILLYIKIRQIPIFWFEPRYKNKSTNLNKRKKFFYIKKKDKKFENLLEDILYCAIPKNYLENYQSIKKSLDESYWPKKIKVIITAYDDTDSDTYKIWSAERCLNKDTRYLIMQHGGHSGTSMSAPGTTTREIVADKYLTWGWKKKNKKIVPFHSVSLSNQKVKFEENNNKKIYFCIQVPGRFPPRFDSGTRNNEQRLRKISVVKSIINNLNNNFTEKVILRYLARSHKRTLVKFDKSGIFKNILYDTGKKPFIKILPKAKIVIHDSNNTGFLESLFFNVPTIMIVDKKIETFEKSARKLTKLLEKKYIIHYDPKTVIDFINKNFDHIDKWWNDKELQKIRKAFCNTYVKKSDNSLGDLAKYLKKISK